MSDKSRCTGCPLFAVCLGEPADIVSNPIFLLIADDYQLRMCPRCLDVKCASKIVNARKLCEKFYNEILHMGFIKLCEKNSDCRAHIRYDLQSPPPTLSFEERPHG